MSEPKELPVLHDEPMPTPEPEHQPRVVELTPSQAVHLQRAYDDVVQAREAVALMERNVTGLIANATSHVPDAEKSAWRMDVLDVKVTLTEVVDGE